MSPRAGWDVVVVGGAATDYLARGAELPSPGNPVQGTDFLETAGGKGVNAAVAASRLGARVALVACVGADERGGRLLAILAGERVDTRHVRRDASAATSVTLIHVAEQGRKQTLAFPGANRSLSLADVRAAAPLLSSTSVLVAQLEPPLEQVREAVGIARSAGARVILDPAPPVPLPDDLLARVDIIKPNSREAESLTGIAVSDRESGRRAADVLLRRGVGAVLVAAGEGSLLALPGEEHWLPRLPVDTVDTTGAGDALAGALAAALAEGRSLLEAARLANAAAALATTRLGALPGLPHRDEVLALLGQGGGPGR